MIESFVPFCHERQGKNDCISNAAAGRAATPSKVSQLQQNTCIDRVNHAILLFEALITDLFFIRSMGRGSGFINMIYP